MGIKNLFTPCIETFERNRNIKKLIKYSGYKKNEDLRIKAIRALGNIGDAQALDSMILLVNEENSFEVKSEAIKTIGKIGDTYALEFLVKYFLDNWNHSAAKAINKIGLEKTSDPVKVACFVCMGNFDEACEMGEIAIKPIMRQIGSLRSHGKFFIIEEQKNLLSMLTKFGDSAIEHLKNILNNGSYDELWHDAAQALIKIDTDLAIEALLDILKKNIFYRNGEIAQKALAEISNAKSTTLFIANLNDDNIAFIKSITEILAERGDKQAVMALCKNLKHEDKYIKETTAKSLAKIGVGSEAIEPLISALNNSKDEFTRNYIAEALGQINDDRVVEALIKALQCSVGRKAILVALGKIGDSNAISPIIEVLVNSHSFEKLDAAKALNQLGWEPDRGIVGAHYWLIKALIAIGSGYQYPNDKKEYEEAINNLLVIGKPAIEAVITEIDRAAPPEGHIKADDLIRLAIVIPHIANQREKNDYSDIINRLTAIRDGYRKSCSSEDTIHGGITLWQEHGYLIKSLDIILQHLQA